MFATTNGMVLYKKVMKNMMRMMYTTRAVHKATFYYLTIRTAKYIMFQLNPFLQKDPPHHIHHLLKTIPHHQVVKVLQSGLQ